jgi:tetratricopeptide (TPR) repeat protein
MSIPLYSRRSVLGWFASFGLNWAAGNDEDKPEPQLLDPRYFLSEGMEHLFETQDYGQAIECFSDALRLDPDNALSLAYLGEAHRKLGSYGQGIQYFQKSIAREPKGAFAFERLAWQFGTCPLSQFRNGEKAVRFARKACTIHRSFRSVGTRGVRLRGNQ